MNCEVRRIERIFKIDASEPVFRRVQKDVLRDEVLIERRIEFLEEINASGFEHATYLRKSGLPVGHMMQHTEAENSIEDSVRMRKVQRVSG
jgi:hypothetical protein